MMSIAMEVKTFVNALIKTKHPPLDGVSLVVLGEKNFLLDLDNEARNPDHPAYIRSLSVLDYKSKLDKDCYYPLDGHMNSKGHKIVAQEILRHIGYQ